MCDENRVDALSNLVANLRDVFPFPSDVDLAEIVHSPEWCLEAMIRYCKLIPKRISSADDYISLLENSADGYYRVEKTKEAKAYRDSLCILPPAGSP